MKKKNIVVSKVLTCVAEAEKAGKINSGIVPCTLYYRIEPQPEPYDLDELWELKRLTLIQPLQQTNERLRMICFPATSNPIVVSLPAGFRFVTIYSGLNLNERIQELRVTVELKGKGGLIF